MPTFTIHGLKQDGTTAKLFYNNETSSLVWENGESVVPFVQGRFEDAEVVSVHEPGRKGAPRILKISLGLSCNYECGYCSQRFVPHGDSTGPEDVEAFVAGLTQAVPTPPERVEFWGGEPFVYWKTFRPLAEQVRAAYPQAAFLVITNGSLLDPEKNEWLDKMGFAVGLSHDGPGHKARGVDPLDDPNKRESIMDLWRRLNPQNRISINPMMHSSNQSRAAVQEWLQARFGDDISIGEGSFIDPYDENGLAATITDPAAHIDYRVRALKELRTGGADRFTIARDKILEFVESIRNARPADALGQKCGMDRKDNLVVDLKGNVLTCQNVSSTATAPNGMPHKIGHLSDLASAKLSTATHWSRREGCRNCPVLQLCKGSCMFLQNQLWDAACESSYSDNIPFLSAAIEFMTGFLPVYIEGELPEGRKDIFGQINGKPKTRPIIPIKAITS